MKNPSLIATLNQSATLLRTNIRRDTQFLNQVQGYLKLLRAMTRMNSARTPSRNKQGAARVQVVPAAPQQVEQPKVKQLKRPHPTRSFVPPSGIVR